jgi:hypothetical protein
LLTGCLATEYKEYRFNLSTDGTGNGSVIFYNLISVEDDEQDVSFKDFGELVSDYVEGTRFEEENPGYTVTNKEIYEENGMLVGKVEFTFEDIKSIGFYKTKNCDCSSLLYYMGDFGEIYSESNGNRLGAEDDMPMIEWEPGIDEIYLKTIVQEELESTHSLLPLYKTWKETK